MHISVLLNSTLATHISRLDCNSCAPAAATVDSQHLRPNPPMFTLKHTRPTALLVRNGEAQLSNPQLTGHHPQHKAQGRTGQEGCPRLTRLRNRQILMMAEVAKHSEARRPQFNASQHPRASSRDVHHFLSRIEGDLRVEHHLLVHHILTTKARPQHKHPRVRLLQQIAVF